MLNLLIKYGLILIHRNLNPRFMLQQNSTTDDYLVKLYTNNIVICRHLKI